MIDSDTLIGMTVAYAMTVFPFLRYLSVPYRTLDATVTLSFVFLAGVIILILWMVVLNDNQDS